MTNEIEVRIGDTVEIVNADRYKSVISLQDIGKQATIIRIDDYDDTCLLDIADGDWFKSYELEFVKRPRK